MASLLRLCVAATVPVTLYSYLQSQWYYPTRYVRSTTFPNLAKKIAHRGSRTEGLPENTIAAFKYALEEGADIIECDVWLTTDKQIVVHHDESLLRMTGLDRKVKDLSYPDIPPILSTHSSSLSSLSKYSSKELETVPLLEEVLDLLPSDRAIIIELKQDSWELIDAVHQLLEKKEKKKSVFWFSLHESINKKLRQKDKSIPTITSIQGMITILLFYYLGILPWIDLEDAVFGITVEEVRRITVLWWIRCSVVL
eukprot:scaffold1036_cov169-Ochromonas_danica.AAC.2